MQAGTYAGMHRRAIVHVPVSTLGHARVNLCCSMFAIIAYLLRVPKIVNRYSRMIWVYVNRGVKGLWRRAKYENMNTLIILLMCNSIRGVIRLKRLSNRFPREEEKLSNAYKYGRRVG